MALNRAPDLLEKRVHNDSRLRAQGSATRVAGRTLAKLRMACQPKPTFARAHFSELRWAKVGAGGRTRTADPALMRRVL